MTRLLLLGLLLVVTAARATEQEVVNLTDPAGDDDGDGTLVYPQRADFQPGDLDIRTLRVVRAGEVYRFEATFRSPVRDPAVVAGDTGPESLALFARRRFYSFNLDVYIDQDRIRGSGNTFTLPGRHVTVDPAYAWEKAVILTPRPELMRQQLVEAIAESEGARSTDDAAKRIDASVFFVTDIRVRDRTVTYTVPAKFFSGSRPDGDWAFTAFVTGAKTRIEAELSLAGSNTPAIERLQLGVMQPKSGQPRDTFGYTGATAPTPIVDLLAPAPLPQHELLAGAPVLKGIGGSAVTEGSTQPVMRITETASPGAGTAPPGETRPVPARAGLAERLRTLEDLRAQGLVGEQEYLELRRKILADL
jgi:hypothetical protein